MLLQPPVCEDYVLEEPIARTHHADIWRAVGPALDGHGASITGPVAIKVVWRSDATHDLARFIREIRLIGTLRHPTVVPIYATGIPDDRAYAWYAMPLATRGTLHEWNHNRPHHERMRRDFQSVACRYVVQVLSALDYVHARRILHRDVKPDNILLHPESLDVRCYLADFGIAHIQGGETITEWGSTVGTPDYMAPEQATAPETIDARADLYAAGSVLFTLLAGRTPFLVGADLTSYQAALAILHAKMEHPAPDIREFVANVPAELARWLAICLAHDPKDRYASARTAAVALSPFAR